jgi:MFS family permease
VPVRDVHLRILAAAIAVSAIGDWVAVVALALRANDMWGGAGVAAFFVCLWSPIALLAGYAGVLVDRLETRGLAIAASVFQGVVALGLAFTSSPVALLVLTFILGIGGAVAASAEFALVPLVAGSRGVGRANGLVESMRGVGFMVGPLLGGALSGALGIRGAILADAATFAVIGAGLTILPVRRRGSAAGDTSPRAREGLQLLYADRTLAVALGAGVVTLVFMSASIPGDVVFTKDVLGAGDTALGVVLTAWAVGMVAAANLIPQRVAAGSWATVALVAACVQGLGKVLPPFWLVLPFMAACYFVGGAGHGVKNAGFRTLIHQHVPPERHGRAFAAYNGLRNAAELIALAGGGVLVSTVGGRGTLWIAGGVSALAAVVGLFVVSTRRQLDAAAANAS